VEVTSDCLFLIKANDDKSNDDRNNIVGRLTGTDSQGICLLVSPAVNYRHTQNVPSEVVSMVQHFAS
jgi:hypothetical protein